jgi:hypothetical protein
VSDRATAQVVHEHETDLYKLGLPADVFVEVLEFESENFFENRDFGSQIEFLLGPGPIDRASFPELEITRDAFLLDLVYRDLLAEQVASDPIIRTPDLANPYGTSLRLRPYYRALPDDFFTVTPTVPGSEFRFDSLPEN